MLSAAQVALFGALSAHFVTAFSPVFSSPRQCEMLRITWTESVDLPVVDMPLTEVFMSLIPLDNDPSRIAPEPYSLSVPSGGHEIAALPFPAGTQFFASAHILGSAGFERRTVSKVFTVEHSDNSHCLPAKAVNMGGRAKAKSFGKRQISVVGTGLVDSTGVPAPANAIASPSSAPPAINVIGVTVTPADGSSLPPSPTTSSSAPSASSSDGAVPPIRVIGTSEHPATGLPVPGNVAPAPSASGSSPEASSSGSSDGAYSPNATYIDTSSAYATETSTSCTETPTEMPDISMVTEWATVTVTMNADHNMASEEPCNESMDSSEYQTMHETIMPPDTITMTSLPTATQSAADTAVVSYTAFNDMVNAANSMFKAWNPYKPAYTPSTGN